MHSKPALRAQFKATLNSLSAADRLLSSTRLRGMLREWPVFRKADVIAVFASTPTEPELEPLMEAEPDKQFVFPRCEPGRQLGWYFPQPGPWVLSGFGIREPQPSPEHRVDLQTLQLVLVPGLAFTEAGIRLGHGAGYYDRFLASLPPATPTAGVCFSCQIAASLPVEGHDIPVQKVFHA